MKFAAVDIVDVATRAGRGRAVGAALVVGVALCVGAGLFVAQPLAGQAFEMNFFIVVKGPTWGPTQPSVRISDSHCHDQAYAEGFGHLTWHVYLTGTTDDGEAGEVARERIGDGPWYNYYGILIAENVAQLHSDANNLVLETAVNVRGQPAPEGVLDLPTGSQLDGGDFTRDGPFLCFGIPG